MIIKLFLVFFKIGAFTFGSGYAMLSIMHRELVENKKWLTHDEFLESLAIAQSSPGPISVNISINIGYRFAGIKGCFAAFLGTILPPFLIILTIAIFYNTLSSLYVFKYFLNGVKPAVISLIFFAFYRLVKKVKLSYISFIIMFFMIVFFFAFKINPIFLILIGGCIGYFMGNRLLK